MVITTEPIVGTAARLGCTYARLAQRHGRATRCCSTMAGWPAARRAERWNRRRGTRGSGRAAGRAQGHQPARGGVSPARADRQGPRRPRFGCPNCSTWITWRCPSCAPPRKCALAQTWFAAAGGTPSRWWSSSKGEAIDQLDAILPSPMRPWWRAATWASSWRPKGADASETHHPARESAWASGDHRDADARVDDHGGDPHARGGVPMSPTPSGTEFTPVMLSGETAVGQRPIAVVEMMIDRIVTAAEVTDDVPQPPRGADAGPHRDYSPRRRCPRRTGALGHRSWRGGHRRHHAVRGRRPSCCRASAAAPRARVQSRPTRVPAAGPLGRSSPGPARSHRRRSAGQYRRDGALSGRPVRRAGVRDGRDRRAHPLVPGVRTNFVKFHVLGSPSSHSATGS